MDSHVCDRPKLFILMGTLSCTTHTCINRQDIIPRDFEAASCHPTNKVVKTDVINTINDIDIKHNIMLLAKSTISYQLYLEYKVESMTCYIFELTSISNLSLTDILKQLLFLILAQMNVRWKQLCNNNTSIANNAYKIIEMKWERLS